MAKRTWRRGEPYHFIPVGDIAQASTWLPYAQTRVEMMMSGTAPVLTEIAPYLRQVFRPAPDVKITIESLYGIPRITIETGGYDYITVGDTFSTWNSLRGLYAGKFGLGKKAKLIDPYAFEPNGTGFARGPDGNIGKSLQYAGGNTFIAGPLPFPPSPAHYAIVSVNGTTPALKLLPTGGTSIYDVFYGGKSPEGVRRYEAYGETNHTIQLPEGFVNNSYNPQAVTSIGAPVYVSTTSIGGAVTTTGNVEIIEAALAAAPIPAGPIDFHAKDYIILSQVDGGDGYTYTGEDAMVVPFGGGAPILAGLYKLSPVSVDSTYKSTRVTEGGPVGTALLNATAFAAVEPTCDIAATVATYTLGDEVTNVTKFEFDLTYKIWPYELTSGPDVYDDLLFARYNLIGSGPHVDYYSGGGLVTYAPTADYEWIKFPNIADGSAARLSNGRIAILTTTNASLPFMKLHVGATVFRNNLYNSTASITDFFKTTITIVSNDNGLTWSAKVTPGEIDVFGPMVYIGGDQILVFGAESGLGNTVWRSDDAGVTYAMVASGLADGAAGFPVCLAPGVAGFYAYRRSPSSGYSRFYRTIDSGATWTSYDIPLEVLTKTGNGFDGRIAILKVGETYATTSLAILVRLDTEIIAGVNTQQSQIIISDDGGETWRLDTKVFPQVFGTDIGALNTGLPPHPGLPDTDQP